MIELEAEELAKLYVGRLDAFGTDAGGCERVENGGSWDDYYSRMQAHVDGRRPFGVYPMLDDGTVSWGAVDIDYEDLPLAKNLRSVLDQLGIPSWIERSRSKGYHLLVFAHTWVPGATMRRALLAACQIVDYTPTEVNPKQWSLGEGQLGNYLRVAYPGRGLHGRQVVLGRNDVPMSLSEFLADVNAKGVAIEGALEAAGQLWTPPREPARKLDFDGFDGDVQLLVDRMRDKNRYALQMFEEGPLEGRDRSTFLAHFCHALAERGGFTPSEALVLVDYLDEWVGKFVGRRDREDQLRKLVERAFA